MIYAIDRDNRHLYTDQIEEMFRLRYRLYVEGRGWKALTRPDKREVDKFDTVDATYLLGIDDIGHVTGGLRLVPTIGPHLIRDVFPHAVQWGRIPSGEAIYELTRCFVVPETAPDQATRRRAAGEFYCAMFEYGLAIGLTHISLLCDTFFLPHMLECGWHARPLGPPTPYDEGECIAVLFEVSEKTLERTRSIRNVRKGPYLATRPFAARPCAPAVAA